MASQVEVAAPASGWTSRKRASSTPLNSTALPRGVSMRRGGPATVTGRPPILSSRSKVQTSCAGASAEEAGRRPKTRSARVSRMRTLCNSGERRGNAGGGARFLIGYPHEPPSTFRDTRRGFRGCRTGRATRAQISIPARAGRILLSEGACGQDDLLRRRDPPRSEERRVGKERRSRWSAHHLKKKKRKK